MPRRLVIPDAEARDLIAAAAGSGVREDEPLSAHTSFGIGGPARLFAEVTSAEALARVVRAAGRAGLDLLVMGGGTNLLVSDRGWDGLAVRVAIDRIDIDTDRRRVRVGAGVSSARLVETLVDEGIGGLEFAAGLPGTIGGAVAGNAGCFGSTVGERLVSADAISREGTALEVEGPGWFGFGYRRSRVAAEGAVLTDVVLAVEPGDRARLREESAARLADRAGRHPPPGTLTAGSYFRNLPPLEPGGRRRAAGLLLDRVGAKEMSEGDAAVFERHANIVVNRGRASARDVLALTRGMAARVEKRFGEVLVPEVRFVGSSPEGF